jgi:hypothetical protein
VYPQRNRRKRPAGIAAVVALALAASGCGGGGGAGTTQTSVVTGQAVRGVGFAFHAPEDWTVDVRPTTAAARNGASSLVSVTVLPLVRPYKPALFSRVVKELDRVASAYAASLKGTVSSRRTVAVAGRRAREYRIAHGDLVDVITFVLRGKRNYQLTCRWRADDGEPDACAQLVSSFGFR